MPKPQVIQQLGQEASEAYQMASPENDIAALKMTLGKFNSEQRQKRFSLYQEGIEQQIYGGQLDEIKGRQMMIDEASRIGLDELDIAKLKTQAAQAAYQASTRGAGGGGGGGGGIKQKKSDIETMMIDDLDKMLSGDMSVVSSPLTIPDPTDFESLRKYFYRHPVYSQLGKKDIDSLIKNRFTSSTYQFNSEEGSLLSQIGL